MMTDDLEAYDGGERNPNTVVIKTAPGCSLVDPDEAEAFADHLRKVASHVRSKS